MLYYTYEQIVSRLTDMERLSLIPFEKEKTGEQSSTDRKSKYDKKNDVYQEWGANADGDGIIRQQEDGGKVLAEINGSGCLWRIWFADPHANGHIKIYLDEQEEAVVDCPTTELFNLSRAPFEYPNLCYVSAKGHNCYVPITFNKSCKVIGYDDFGRFYQFTYSVFGNEVDVEPFPSILNEQQRNALQETNDTLGSSFCPPLKSDQHTEQINAECVIPSNGSSVVVNLSGTGAICYMEMYPQNITWRESKELTVSIYWDGEETPSVWAPFCDFFGSACGKNNYSSLPLGICDNGWFYSRWFMPYTNGAKIVLTNDGNKPLRVKTYFCISELSRPTKEYMRFHAKWNRDTFQPLRKDRWPDYTVLKAKGRGRFLGFMLHVFRPVDNQDMKSIPGEYWWGEGDEKIFVDGEKEPSSFGTGTEDYFGYAWATPELFSRAYHAHTFDQGGIHNRGNQSFVRYQIADSVPFQNKLEVCIEKYYDNNFARYGTVPYWYMEAGASDDYQSVSLSGRTEYYDEDPDQILERLTNMSILPNSNFASGNLAGWTVPSDGAFKNANVMVGETGNYFTYSTKTADGNISELCSKCFFIDGDNMDFLLGGTWRRDPEGSFAALVCVDDGKILARSCCESENMCRVVWDVRDYHGMKCCFKIIDEGKGGFRSLSFGDLHVSGELA